MTQSSPALVAFGEVAHNGPPPVRHWLMLQLGLSLAGWTVVAAGLFWLL